MPSKPNKRGPKPKIDAKAEAEIYAILATGGSFNDAADYLGIDRTTLNRKKARDSKFAKGVDRAIAQGKLRLVQKIGKAEAWQAAAWMLERKWGAEFGKRDQLDVTSAGNPIMLRPIKLDGDKQL